MRTNALPISNQLLDTLVCPETGQKLRSANDVELRSLNERITSGKVSDRAGNPVKQPLDAALIRDDGRLFFPFEDGFPVVLCERAIVTAPSV